MKNAVRAVLVLFFSILGIVQINAAENELKAYYNDAQILFEDMTPRIVNGKAMVPMRQTFSAMGNNRVTWIPEERRVQFEDNVPTLMTIQIDNHYIYRVGRRHDRMDVPPLIIGDRTFVSLNFVAEIFGKNVTYNEDSSSIVFTDRIQDDWYKDGVNNIKFKLISNMRRDFLVSNYRKNERPFLVSFVDQRFPGSYIVPSVHEVYKFPLTESVEDLINNPPVFSLERHEFNLNLTEQDEELGFYSGIVNFYIRREYEYKIYYRILLSDDHIYYSMFFGDETRTRFSEDEVRKSLMSTTSFSL